MTKTTCLRSGSAVTVTGTTKCASINEEEKRNLLCGQTHLLEILFIFPCLSWRQHISLFFLSFLKSGMKDCSLLTTPSFRQRCQTNTHTRAAQPLINQAFTPAVQRNLGNRKETSGNEERKQGLTIQDKTRKGTGKQKTDRDTWRFPMTWY